MYALYLKKTFTLKYEGENLPSMIFRKLLLKKLHKAHIFTNVFTETVCLMKAYLKASIKTKSFSSYTS